MYLVLFHCSQIHFTVPSPIILHPAPCHCSQLHVTDPSSISLLPAPYHCSQLHVTTPSSMSLPHLHATAPSFRLLLPASIFMILFPLPSTCHTPSPMELSPAQLLAAPFSISLLLVPCNCPQFHVTFPSAMLPIPAVCLCS